MPRCLSNPKQKQVATMVLPMMVQKVPMLTNLIPTNRLVKEYHTYEIFTAASFQPAEL